MSSSLSFDDMTDDARLPYRNILVYDSHYDNRKPKSKSCGEAIQNELGKFFSKKTLYRRLPCLNWMFNYSKESLIGDMVAGLTVGLLIIPQALAYGSIAGLAPNYGLYSAITGCFIYAILGCTKELSVGPTAIMSLLTFQYTLEGGEHYAVFLSFTSGVIILLSGILNLSFLINFISDPVIRGFISAAAVTICSSQVNGLLGLKLRPKGVVDTWYQMATNISDTIIPDIILGLCCIAFLIIMKYMKEINWKCLDKEKDSSFRNFTRSVIAFLSIGRNAIVVIISSIIAYSFSGGRQPFTLTDVVTPGLPTLEAPSFSTTINNQTLTFTDMLEDIGSGIVIVPFISLLTAIAVVSGISKGKSVDAKQEMIALGVINILGSFIHSMPTTACLSRTAVSSTSGVKTTAGGLVTGCIIILALVFLTPFFKFIPKATLSSVIICAVVTMIDYDYILPVWRSKKLDLLPFTATFFVGVFVELQWGLLLGIALHLFLLLFFYAKPKVRTVLSTFQHQSRGEYVLVTPSNGMAYPNSEHIRSAISKAGMEIGNGRLPVIVNCSFITSLDFTSIKGFKRTVDDFELRNQVIVFLHIQPQILKMIESLKTIVTCDSLIEAQEYIENTNDCCPKFQRQMMNETLESSVSL